MDQAEAPRDRSMPSPQAGAPIRQDRTGLCEAVAWGDTRPAPWLCAAVGPLRERSKRMSKSCARTKERELAGEKAQALRGECDRKKVWVMEEGVAMMGFRKAKRNTLIQSVSG